MTARADIEKLAAAHGWSVERTPGGHLKLRHAQADKFVIASATPSDHMARPSSPVLRMKLFATSEFVTPLRKFRASASWSTMMLSVTLMLSIGPSNHAPTLVWWM